MVEIIDAVGSVNLCPQHDVYDIAIVEGEVAATIERVAADRAHAGRGPGRGHGGKA